MNSPCYRASALLGALLVAFLSNVPARAQTISSVTPAAVAPGKPLQLTLRGAKLTNPLTVWTSFPAKVEALTPAKDGKSATCKVTVPPGTPVGVGGLIAANASGVSEAFLLLVDDLPSVAENGKNNQRATPQEIAFPSAVDGASSGTAFDFFGIAAKKGQRISVEIFAQRIGSAMDPVIRVLDASGKELGMVDDDPGLGADCRLRVTAPADGKYIIEVRDNRYQSGGRYRLRIGDFPLITAPLPLGGRRGSTARLRFSGPAADDTPPMIIKVPETAPTGRVGVSVKAPGGKSSAIGVLAASDMPEELEQEPNDQTKLATDVTLPCAVSGVLADPGDEDLFRFAAVKGQRIDLRGFSRSFGSPCFLSMRILDASGKQLAASGVTNNEEPTLAYTSPGDGIYHLAIRDLLRRGGAGYAYRIQVQTGPGFSLVLKNDKTTKRKFTAARSNGAFGLSVQSQRRGYNGPITLGVKDPQSGVRLHNNVIPAGKNEVRMFVTLPPTFKEGDFRALRIIGTATINGREVQAQMRTEPTLRAKFPNILYPYAWQDGLITMTTGAPAKPFYGVKADKPKLTVPQAGAASAVLTLERKVKDFKAGMTVLPDDLPPGYSVAVKAAKDKYTVTVTRKQDAPKTAFSLKLRSIAEHKGAGQTIVTQIPVEVAAAVSAK